MFKHIMIPVDLRLDDIVGRALDAATDLAKHYGARLTLVSLTGTPMGTPNEVEQEAIDKLNALAERAGNRTGGDVTAMNLSSPDVAAQLDAKLMQAVEDTGADLVVMGSHVPGLLEYVFASHAGKLASHAKVSVFVVR